MNDMRRSLVWQRVGFSAVAPDLPRRRSDATLVEGFVTARLLGMRILTLEATVALVPADVEVATPPVAAPPPVANPPVEHRVVHAPGPSFAARRGRAGAAGPRLADAVRNLDEGAKVLAKVRRPGL
jgi:hypothetical protein